VASGPVLQWVRTVAPSPRRAAPRWLRESSAADGRLLHAPGGGGQVYSGGPGGRYFPDDFFEQLSELAG